MPFPRESNHGQWPGCFPESSATACHSSGKPFPASHSASAQAGSALCPQTRCFAGTSKGEVGRKWVVRAPAKARMAWRPGTCRPGQGPTGTCRSEGSLRRRMGPGSHGEPSCPSSLDGLWLHHDPCALWGREPSRPPTLLAGCSKP